MRNKQHVMKEIVELCAIKASYNYYLASHIAQFEVENTTQVQQNLKTLTATLRGLYEELKDLNKRDKDEKQKITAATHKSSNQFTAGSNPTQPETINTKQQRYLQNMKAIMLFNADRRFTITE